MDHDAAPHPPSNMPNNGHFNGPNDGGRQNISGDGWGQYENHDQNNNQRQSNSNNHQWQVNNSQHNNHEWQQNSNGKDNPARHNNIRKEGKHQWRQQSNNNQWEQNNRQRTNQYQNHPQQSQQNNQEQNHFSQTSQNSISQNSISQNSHSNSNNHGNQIQSKNHGNKLQYSVLYTHQKTKKKPTWKDGRLVITGIRGTLYDANPPPGSGDAPLDNLEVNATQASNSMTNQSNLESEKYLIQVEGPWRPINASNALATRTNGPSEGMKRVLTKKFVRPKKVMPNFEEQRRLKMEKENKRRRVLQPGELERMYYGGGGLDGGWGYNNEGFAEQNGYGPPMQNGYDSQLSDTNSYHDPRNNRFNPQNGYSNQGGKGYPNANAHSQNLQSGGPGDRYTNGLPQRDFNQNNNCGYGENQRGSQNRGGPVAFQSNGVDASGFYQEEEEDDEEEQDWTDNDQNGEQQGVSKSNYAQTDQNNQGTGYLNISERNSQSHQRSFQNSSGDNNQSVSSNQQQAQPAHCFPNTNSCDQSQDDQRVTDDLLALLGVTTASREQHNVSTRNNEVSNENNSSTAGPHDANALDPSNKAVGNKSSFLESLDDSEDDLNDDQQPMAFDFNRQDSFDNGQDSNYDDGESFNLDDELANVDEETVDVAAEAPITGLSLPDPDDSSSDDDSLAE